MTEIIEVVGDYNWKCPNCGESGYLSNLEKQWKYCPYCASEIKLEKVVYEVNKK